MSNLVSERVVEDILSADRSILADILRLKTEGLSLIAQQKALESGRLDLLYLYEDELLLIELKVVPFYDDIVRQVDGYYRDLKILQEQHRLIDADIRKVVLVTDASEQDVAKCKAQSIHIVRYEPQHVLTKYYENFKQLSYFLTIQSADYGVVRLGLLNTTVWLLSSGRTIKEICQIQSRSPKTIRNRLSVAALLNLVTRYGQAYYLTEFGNAFLEKGARKADDRLTDSQAELMCSFVAENPFHSSMTYTILSMVEAIFFLAKNSYPVPRSSVQDYFVKSVGKERTWRRPKARETAAYIFANYSAELGLVSRIDDCFYITPKGIQAVLLLQLNRSIKLIESQSK